MARTRSQPVSPGGLKSLEDLPKKRRATRASKPKTTTTTGAADVESTAATVGSDHAASPLRPVRSGKVRKARKTGNKASGQTATTRLTRAQRAKLEAQQALEASAYKPVVEPVVTQAEETPASTESEQTPSSFSPIASPPKETAEPLGTESEGHDTQASPALDTLPLGTPAHLSLSHSQVVSPFSPRQPPLELLSGDWSPSPNKYYGGPNPYYRFAVWNNASKYLDESEFIQHEPVTPAVLGEVAETAVPSHTPDLTSSPDTVAVPDLVISSTPVAQDLEDPMEIDFPPLDISKNNNISPIDTQEFDSECQYPSIVFSHHGGLARDRLMSSISVRQFLPITTLTRQEVATPVDRKRPRPQDGSDDDEPSAKRRDLRELMLAHHKGRQAIPFGQRRSQRVAQKRKGIFGTRVFDNSKAGDSTKSPEPPKTPGDTAVLPASQAGPTPQQAPSTPSRPWSIRGLLSSVPRSLSRLISSFGDREPPSPTSPLAQGPESTSLPVSPSPSTTSTVEDNVAEPTTDTTSAGRDTVSGPVSDTAVDSVSEIDKNPTRDTVTDELALKTNSGVAATESMTSSGQKNSQVDRHGIDWSRPELQWSLYPRRLTREILYAPLKNEVTTSEVPVSVSDPAPVAVSAPVPEVIPVTEDNDNKEVKTPVTKRKKRKRSPTPEKIPNPPGCSYGVWDKYFYYSSDSEEDEEDVEESSQPEPPTIPASPAKSILRARKRVRFDVSPQDTPSKLRLQQTTAMNYPPTPSRPSFTPSRLSREISLDEFEEQASPSITTVSASEVLAVSPTPASKPFVPNPTGTYGWFPELYSSSEDELEEETDEPEESKVMAGTFALKWPAPVTYIPVDENVDPMVLEQFGREFNQLKGALVI